MTQAFLKDPMVIEALTRLPANDRVSKEQQIIEESRNVLLMIDGDKYEEMNDLQAEKFINQKRTEIAKKLLGV